MCTYLFIKYCKISQNLKKKNNNFLPNVCKNYFYNYFSAIFTKILDNNNTILVTAAGCFCENFAKKISPTSLQFFI